MYRERVDDTKKLVDVSLKEHKSFVPWRMLALLVTITVMVLGSGFAILVSQVEAVKTQNEHIRAQLVKVDANQQVLQVQMRDVRKAVGKFSEP